MGNFLTLPNVTVGPANQPATPPATPAVPEIRVLTCPSGFASSAGTPGYCYVQCAAGYTPVGETMCQHNTETSIRYIRSGTTPGNVSQEQSAREVNTSRLREANARVDTLRAQREAEAARMAEKQGALNAVGPATEAKALVQSQQAQFNQSARLVQDTTDRLRVRRPPVQPDSEIAMEQQRIQNIIQKNALFIQVVLLLVVLCAVAYMLLPLQTANYAALAILSVAVLYRIFFVK
jgi:hypothetical protein